MIFSLLLVACGGLRGTPNDTATDGDTGIDVYVEYRGGSNQSSGGSSNDGTGDDTAAPSTTRCYWDDDGDGHGNGSGNSGTYLDIASGQTCPAGYVTNGDDQCDNDAGAYTAADCAARAADADADGVSIAAGDCNDNDVNVYPGLAETCDGLDNDCDGSVDEDATDATVWYSDADGDGYGTGESIGTACDEVDSRPDNSSAVNTDCDDTNAATNPGATEVEGDGIDNNCDGTMAGESAEMTCCFEGDPSDCMVTTDSVCPSDYIEVTAGMTCCADADNDGYGDADVCEVTFDATCFEGEVEGDGDCDDSHYGTSPAEDDPYGDGRDTDCDGYDG